MTKRDFEYIVFRFIKPKTTRFRQCKAYKNINPYTGLPHTAKFFI